MITMERKKQIYYKMKETIEERIVMAEVVIRHLNRLLIIKKDQNNIAQQLTQSRAQKEAWEAQLLTINDIIEEVSNDKPLP